MTVVKFNLRFTDQISYLNGIHRSGWPMVMRNLLTLHDNDAPVWLDTYVDRTFHWLKPTYIPYTRAWAGFVHHTWNTDFSQFNNVQLLKNQQFLDSLPFCKGLYVFGTPQATRWRQALDTLGFGSVLVQSLVHPTDLTGFPKWTPEAFLANPQKRLVQIGAWLRDNYAIYRFGGAHHSLSIPYGNGNDTEAFTLTKSALKGPEMDFYFKPLNFFRLLRAPQWKEYVSPIPPMSYRVARVEAPSSPVVEIISANGELNANVIAPTDEENEDLMCRDNMCRDVMCRDSDLYLNKYVLGSIDVLKNLDVSVTVLPTMSSTDYDVLLSTNIVFLPLVDAAAVNTLIECIARNTPVLVTPLPAVVELLGADYPLYFVNEGSLTRASIMAAYSYMLEMDKSTLNASYFLNAIVTGPIYTAI